MKPVELVFTGVVCSRSSTKPHGPPGEAEIHKLNPQRKEMILNATGWDAIFPGSLNVHVQQDIVDRLLLCEPLIKEPGETVIYPQRYKYIPKMRVEYLYYNAVASCAGSKEDVIVRRARNPVAGVVELLAPKKLRDTMSLKDGDQITCRIIGLKNHVGEN